MSAFLLSVHVLAAILTVGPVAIAASMFPRYARVALASPGDTKSVSVVNLLHRITRVYAVIGVLVPVFGLATAASIGVLGDTWLIISMILTALAAALLIAFILPAQTRVVRAVDSPQDDDSAAPSSTARRLGMLTGVFNLLWLIVVVLMIYRPGSTTGVGL
ncbi:DUF2269 family protein [Cryocola sp. 340MFSha3.1]|uniref:DUF2269 family protein n=1 Tax=Cryocola sp. 340MFSha3.1 TaxID=1169145 RepID=UPI0003810DB5|nr:DUF2269 family protein [Cryocola sp. 340MFSha3.1]